MHACALGTARISNLLALLHMPGKPLSGIIDLRVSQTSNNLLITFSDL
jgi:hypothetical protein